MGIWLKKVLEVWSKKSLISFYGEIVSEAEKSRRLQQMGKSYASSATEIVLGQLYQGYYTNNVYTIEGV